MNRHKFIIHILLGLLLTFLGEKTFAECLAWKIRVFPNSITISSNPIFIVEGYAMSESVIRELNKRNAIYLTSGSDTIQLTILKILEGQFRLTQAILKPTSKLQVGRHYKMEIDSLDEYEREDFERDSAAWTVSDMVDNQKPVWCKSPSYKSKGMIFYGCGPAVLVNFCACISDNSPVVVYTKIKNMKSNQVNDYYINPDSCFLQIGHEMCSGAFGFELGKEYEVSFSLMDASGNLSETETQPIKFIAPTEKDEMKHAEKEPNCDCPANAHNKETNNNFWLIVGIVLFILFATTVIILKQNATKQ
jgi:hypothetical protein